MIAYKLASNESRTRIEATAKSWKKNAHKSRLLHTTLQYLIWLPNHGYAALKNMTRRHALRHYINVSDIFDLCCSHPRTTWDQPDKQHSDNHGPLDLLWMNSRTDKRKKSYFLYFCPLIQSADLKPVIPFSQVRAPFHSLFCLRVTYVNSAKVGEHTHTNTHKHTHTYTHTLHPHTYTHINTQIR